MGSVADAAERLSGVAAGRIAGSVLEAIAVLGIPVGLELGAVAVLGSTAEPLLPAGPLQGKPPSVYSDLGLGAEEDVGPAAAGELVAEAVVSAQSELVAVVGLDLGLIAWIVAAAEHLADAEDQTAVP